MGILWLASYPKSGNTWLRAFLANYLSGSGKPLAINDLDRYCASDAHGWPYERISGRECRDLSETDMERLRPQVHEMLAAGRPETVFVKTHNAIVKTHGVPTITPGVTAGAIYVVRNPLDVVPSYASHYGLSISQAVEVLASHRTTIHGNEKLVTQVLSAWSHHVRSWTEAPGLKLHVVRYEDMAARPLKAFGGVIDFLGLPKSMDRLKRAVRFSDFSELSRQEERSGFRERSRNADRFFRQGKAGGWRDALSDEQVARVVAAHGAMMARHKYLKEDGTVVDG